MKPQGLVRIVFYSIVLLIVCIDNLKSQERITQTDNQQWLQYYNTVSISESLYLNSDAGVRWRSDLSEISQVLARFGIGKKVGDKLKVLAGMAYLAFYEDQQATKAEIRPHQEMIMINRHDRFSFQHRYRLEERFVHNQITNSWEFNFRIRYRLSALYPVFTSKSLKAYAKLADELFIDAGKAQSDIFSENRLVIGSELRFSPSFSLSPLFMKRLKTSTPDQSYSLANIIWLGVKQKF